MNNITERITIPLGTHPIEEKKMVRRELNDVYKKISVVIRWGTIPISKLSKHQLQAVIYLLLENE